MLLGAVVACSSALPPGPSEPVDDAAPAGDDDASAPPPPSDAGPPPALSGPLDRARVFFIGHSLVNHEMPAMVAGLARSAGLDFDYQTQVINGAPLHWNWDNAHQGEGRQSRIGNARAELPSGRFDVVIMTEGIPLDVDTVRAGGNFFRLAVESNPQTRVFMYETWHSLVWEDVYDVYNRYEPDRALHIPGRNSYDWRALLDDLRPAWTRRIDGINTENPAGLRMAMVPAGSAVARLVDEIEAGRVPGIRSRRDLFTDDIHLSDLGNYFVALVQFATIFRRSPEGLTTNLQDQWGRAFRAPTAEQAAIFQRVAWEHVSRDPRAGVRAD